ncbi:LysR substrate-binding domain-containing protein [Paraburkholderia fungorum]|uniref:LysR substrate-binding domain-containing protein n=1 Tax=Paraburkholderia fungorum TaxID=134537 RepID=UPI0038BB9471
MRYRLPPLNTFRIFEAVMRRGSIRQAADELCITPQAVSHQLKLLEESLGRSLFDRHVRSVAATESAEMLVEYVRRGLDQISEGVTMIKKARATPKLFLHVSPYFATACLIRNLGHFTRQFPELDFRMSIGVDLVDFDDLGVDAAIHWGYGGNRDFTEVPLIEDLKVLAAAPALLKQNPVEKPEDLLRHTLISPLGGNSLWRDTLALLGIEERHSQPTLLLHTHSAMLEATLAGLGVGFISYLDALTEIRAGRLIAPFGIDLLSKLPLEKTPKFFLLYKNDRENSDTLMNFAEWLQQDVCREEIIGYPSRCR